MDYTIRRIGDHTLVATSIIALLGTARLAAEVQPTILVEAAKKAVKQRRIGRLREL